MIEEKVKGIEVKTLLEEKSKDLCLSLISGNEGLKKRITVMDISRPGLALAGYLEFFMKERIQIIGKTEHSFLGIFDNEKRREAIRNITRFTPPCIIITTGIEPFEELKQECEKAKISLIKTEIPTTSFIHELTGYLDWKLAPETFIHGTLIDVYGVGLLITGKSGIGKSEIGLDLVGKGHKLISDDLVRIKRRRNGILIGDAPQENPILKHYMEIRGLGIINLFNIFGIRSIRLQKKVDIVVELVEWRKNLNYDRLGLDMSTQNILGIEIPKVVIPVRPGRNLTIICEVIAMNYLAKLKGIESAKIFDEALKREMLRELNKKKNEKFQRSL